MRKRWLAILCALVLTLGTMPGVSAASLADSGTGSITAGSQWRGTELRVPQDAQYAKFGIQCSTGKMMVELTDDEGRVLMPQRILDANSSNGSFVNYIKRTEGYYGTYRLRWRSFNEQEEAVGTYFWTAISKEQQRWEEIFGNQAWATDGNITVVSSTGEKEPLPLYTSLYPDDLKKVVGNLSAPDTYEGENGGLSSIAFRRDLDITPLTYGQLPAMFYRFNANGKKVLIQVKAESGSLGGCDLLIKNETTGELLAWVPGMTAGGGRIILPTEYGVRYGVYAASSNDALGTAQLSITDDLPDNAAPDSVHVANPRKSGSFAATAAWDGLGLQVGENVEIFRLVVQCDTGSMTVRVVDDNNHLVVPTQFLTSDSDSEASSFNFILHRAEGYTGSYAIWWTGADGQGATGSYSWAAVKEGEFGPGVDGQFSAPTVTEEENNFRHPYQNITISGGDYSGVTYPFKLEDNENYFRVAVRNDMAPEIGNITVSVYKEGDHLPYVSYLAKPGEWTAPFVFRGTQGTTYHVALHKSAATPELVEGLISVKCAPEGFE